MKIDLGIVSEKTYSKDDTRIAFQPLGTIILEDYQAKILLPKGYKLVGPKIVDDPDMQILVISKHVKNGSMLKPKEFKK